MLNDLFHANFAFKNDECSGELCGGVHARAAAGAGAARAAGRDNLCVRSARSCLHQGGSGG